MKMTVFWDVAPCSLAEVYRGFSGDYYLIVEAVSISETSVNYQATQRNIPEDRHLHTRRQENLKSHRACIMVGILFGIYQSFQSNAKIGTDRYLARDFQFMHNRLISQQQ
jgi:hypothetical protein